MWYSWKKWALNVNDSFDVILSGNLSKFHTIIAFVNIAFEQNWQICHTVDWQFKNGTDRCRADKIRPGCFSICQTDGWRENNLVTICNSVVLSLRSSLSLSLFLVSIVLFSSFQRRPLKAPPANPWT